jgi:hypothetical protein
MFSHYVIEAGEEQAGLVILERGGFRFYAAKPTFAEIEGTLYRSAVEATRAAERVMGRQSRPARPPAVSPAVAAAGQVATSLLL